MKKRKYEYVNEKMINKEVHILFESIEYIFSDYDFFIDIMLDNCDHDKMPCGSFEDFVCHLGNSEIAVSINGNAYHFRDSKNLIYYLKTNCDSKKNNNSEDNIWLIDKK